LPVRDAGYWFLDAGWNKEFFSSLENSSTELKSGLVTLPIEIDGELLTSGIFAALQPVPSIKYRVSSTQQPTLQA
jgi:hypothetical protein